MEIPENSKFFSDFLKGKNIEKLTFVFDLDSTLFDVTPRTQAIFDDFRASKDSQDLPVIQFKKQEWGLREAFARANIKVNNPLFIEFRNLWRQHFFASPYLKHDQPYPCAIEFVKHLENCGAKIVYLTGRDFENMSEGTIASLKAHELPLSANNSNLYMKPEKTWGQDAEYKSRILSELEVKLQGYQIILFDNEPAILNMCQVKNPNVKLVYTDTVHSGAEDILPQVYHLKGWCIELNALIHQLDTSN